MTTVTFDSIVNRLEHVQTFDRYVLASCVFHTDSKPSMLVFRDGWFRCLGCGRTGKWNSLWDRVNGRKVTVTPDSKISYAPPIGGEGLEETCYQAHMDLIQFPSFQWYLEDRGIADRVETNEIGYRLGWYTFPVRDAEGAFQSAVFRTAPHVQEVSGIRYWCKSVPMPYVPDWFSLKNAKSIFVVYGILDALTLSSLRFPVMTSTAGNNTFNAEWLNEYRVPIYILPDSGEETQGMRLASQLGWRGKVIKLNFPIGKKDVNGFFEVGMREELRAQLARYY